MSKPRLYRPPSHTLDTLRAIISGNRTTEQIADELGVKPNTAKNKIHDPLHLGLIEANDGTYEATDDARRLVQLEETEILKDQFVELPGVGDVLDRLENGGITTEEVGRIISFETESGAADTERFTEYGRVYARWIHHLGLGAVEDRTPESQHPLENPRGANNPRVRPPKVIEALRVLDDVDTKAELADRLGYSERYTQKILGTCYALGLARAEQRGDFATTGTGRTLTTTSKGKQRELLRDTLLEVPLVRAYCNRVPDGEFTNRDVMAQVCKDYSLGWSEGTIDTRAKRLYRWLVFTGLTEEVTNGVLEPTEKMPRDDLRDP